VGDTADARPGHGQRNQAENRVTMRSPAW